MTDAKPQKLIGQGGETPHVTDYAELQPSEGPYFGFVREVKGLDDDGVPSWKVAAYFAAESGKRGDHIYPLNVVVQRNAGDPLSDQVGCEINVNNNGKPLTLNEIHWLTGLIIGSGGKTHPGVGAHIGSTSKDNAFVTGLKVDAAKAIGLDITQAEDGEGIIIRRNNDTHYKGWAIRFLTADGKGVLWGIDYDGNEWIRGTKVAG